MRREAFAAALSLGVAVWTHNAVGSAQQPGWETQPPIEALVTGRSGVTVMVFADWQCPSCVALENELVALRQEWAKTTPPAIKYVRVEAPLDSKCNPRITSRLHKASCEAAIAYRLAVQKGKEKDFLSFLTARHATLTREDVIEASRTMLGVNDFEGEYVRRISELQADLALGAAARVQALPAVYVNGRYLHDGRRGPPSIASIQKAIEFELARGR